MSRRNFSETRQHRVAMWGTYPVSKLNEKDTVVTMPDGSRMKLVPAD